MSFEFSPERFVLDRARIATSIVAVLYIALICILGTTLTFRRRKKGNASIEMIGFAGARGVKEVSAWEFRLMVTSKQEGAGILSFRYDGPAAGGGGSRPPEPHFVPNGPLE